MPEGDTVWVSPVSGVERFAPQSPEASMVPDADELMGLGTAEFVRRYLDTTGAPDMIDAHASLYDLVEGPGAVAKEGYYAPQFTPEERAEYERYQTELIRRAAIRLGILGVNSGEAQNNG